jgi:hypothetical protein
LPNRDHRLPKESVVFRLPRLLLAFAVFAAIAPASMLAAQETPVPPSGEAGQFLPGPSAFGDGWSQARSAALDVDTDVFRDGAVSSLTGPAGARLVLVVLLVTRDRVAVRRSWESALKIYDNYSGELEHLAGRDDELNSVPPPPGCVEAKRIDGTAKQLGIDTGIPMGITLCAADPDIVVIAVASGMVGGKTGFEASDAIASSMVAPSAATPATS